MLHRLKAPELVVRDPVGTEVGPSLPACLVAALGERGGDGSPALAADRFTVHVADGVAGPSRALVIRSFLWVDEEFHGSSGRGRPQWAR